MDVNSDVTLRHMIRTRLVAGSLIPVDGKVVAGKGTGKPCIICRVPISADGIEHEVVGPPTIFAHRECYAIWWQESDAVAQTPRQPDKKTSPLHIDREDGDGVNPHTTEYALSFVRSKDRVGTVLIAKRKGLDALRTFP